MKKGKRFTETWRKSKLKYWLGNLSMFFSPEEVERIEKVFPGISFEEFQGWAKKIILNEIKKNDHDSYPSFHTGDSDFKDGGDTFK